MKFWKASLAGAIMAAAVAAFAQEPVSNGAAANLPSGENVLDRYVEVTGGKAAYEKRRSEYSKGKVRFPAMNVEGSVEIWASAPNNGLTVVELPGVGRIESGSNGKDVWEVSAVMGPRVVEDEEKADILRLLTFNLPVRWREIYPKVENAGVEKFDGAECYKVIATPASGRPETHYFDVKSGLNVAVHRTMTTAMGEVKAEIIMKDYVDRDGVLTPSTLVQKVNGQEMVIQTESVVVNAPIPNGKFTPPSEIQQLLKPKDKAPAPAKKAA